MSCTNPLKAFKIGVNKDTGKAKLKITSRDVTYLERNVHSWIKHYDDIDANISNEKIISQFDYIPCGSCLSCRLAYSRDWSVRCMCEAQYHNFNYFVTLTYADDSLPFNVDVYTGELTGKSTLVKSDLQKFYKRVRKNYKFDNHLSYYSCGEYGSISQRPHYHILFFGLELDDLSFYKKTDLGYDLFTSDFLSRCWPFGYVIVAPLSFESASYVARYNMKKQKDFNPDVYDDFLIEPEFTTMSLKPAIGYQYYEDHKFEIYKYDAIYFPDGKVFKPPKYFDILFDREFPDRMSVIKENRKRCAELTTSDRLSNVDYDFDELLFVDDYFLKERTHSLLRKEV